MDYASLIHPTGLEIATYGGIAKRIPPGRHMLLAIDRPLVDAASLKRSLFSEPVAYRLMLNFGKFRFEFWWITLC